MSSQLISELMSFGNRLKNDARSSVLFEADYDVLHSAIARIKQDESDNSYLNKRLSEEVFGAVTLKQENVKLREQLEELQQAEVMRASLSGECAMLREQLADVSGQRDSCIAVYEEQLSRMREQLELESRCRKQNLELARESLIKLEAAEAKLNELNEQEPWMHSCNALCQDGVELWVDSCPHCGKPRNKPIPPLQDCTAKWNMTADALVDCIKQLEAAYQRIAELERMLEAAQTSIEWWMKSAECTKEKIARAREEGRKDAVQEAMLIADNAETAGYVWIKLYEMLASTTKPEANQ